MEENNTVKEKVLTEVANGLHWRKVKGRGVSKWEIGKYLVHVRFRSDPKADGVTYAYNINPNTLDSDFELWICGNAETFYLISIDVIQQIYDDPDVYVDKAHPKIRVIDIHTVTHRALYGRGGKDDDFSSFYRAKISNH
jgi:hypothetical protein